MPMPMCHASKAVPLSRSTFANNPRQWVTFSLCLFVGFGMHGVCTSHFTWLFIACCWISMGGLWLCDLSCLRHHIFIILSSITHSNLLNSNVLKTAVYYQCLVCVLVSYLIITKLWTTQQLSFKVSQLSIHLKHLLWDFTICITILHLLFVFCLIILGRVVDFFVLFINFR